MRAALQNFQLSLDHIRAGANHVLQNSAAALADPALRSVFETLQTGAVVLLTGYFESFLKECVKAFVDTLSGSGAAFSSLPDVIRNTHFESGGKILSEASEAARKGKTTFFGTATRDDIAARLSSVVAKGGSYQIVWEAFANTRENPKPDVVKELARSLGQNDAWRAIAAKASRSGAARVNDTVLTLTLNDLISKRNECAHTGTAVNVPTATQLQQYADTLAVIAEGFVGMMEDLMKKHIAEAVPPSAAPMPPSPP